MKKHTYHICNWPEYNASLKQLGSLTVWISSEAVENWTADELTGEPGASPTYTDLAIETMATIQAIYGLAGRQTQGFLQSIFELMKLNLPVPDPRLRYGQVIKHRVGRRLISVTRRVVFGLAEMEFSPGLEFPDTVLADFQLAFAVYLDSGRVDIQVERVG